MRMCVLLLVAGCATVGRPLPPVRASSLRITFVDVGEGDAILIQHGGTNLLLDTGQPRGCKNLLAALGHMSIRALFLTHPHSDHFGCAEDVLAALPVAEIITNGETRGP